MIGKLTGTVDSQGPDWLILDVHGVGYVVSCSPRTLARLPTGNERVSLSIETQMREDAIRLYGFASESERDWFRLLQGVQGVGAKVALAILGVLAPDQLMAAIGRGDRAAVSQAPGVGAKLAARILAELKEKAPLMGGALPDAETAAPTALPSQAQDAVSALLNLGYARPQVAAAVAQAVATVGAEASTAVLVRQGLKILAS